VTTYADWLRQHPETTLRRWSPNKPASEA